jgi:hypothetical protein
MMAAVACRAVSAAFLALCLSLTAFAEERIREYRSDITLQADGTLAVTETLQVRVEGKQIQRGIYRDFPTRYRDRFGNFVRVTFRPISVRRNGETEPWHTQDRANGVRLYAGSSGVLLEAGTHVYELTYLTDRQLGFFESHDELYFNVVGNGWLFQIDRAVATVTLPFQVAADRLSLSSYTGRLDSTETAATAEVLDGRRIRFETTRALLPNEAMTIAVGWPKGLVEEPGPWRRIRWFLSDNDAILALLMGLLVPALWYAWAWRRVGRDPRKGVIIPRFEPPEGLSPAACRYVKSMSLHRDAFSAAIISLAVKGYVIIEETNKEFTLQRLPASPGTPLSEGEAAVLESLLPGPGSRIVLEQENHQTFQAAKKALHSALKKEYQGRLFNLNRVYLLPALLMTVLAVITALFLGVSPLAWIVYPVLAVGLHGLFVFLLRSPTRTGRQVMDEIEGFERYLDTGEQQRLERMRSPALTPELFEAFLPYAFALGVENSWCERFAREIPEELKKQSGAYARWYHGPHRGIGSIGHLGTRFGHSFSSAIASASTAPGSSSGAGGGGSAGGGGGGGGGGGW